MSNRNFPLSTLLILSITLCASIYMVASNYSNTFKSKKTKVEDCCKRPIVEQTKKVDTLKPCVFKTIFEGQHDDSDFVFATPLAAKLAIEKALKWMAAEQLQDGSYYGGYHSTQNILKDPNAKGDPATTAMVAIAFLKSGSTPFAGPYADQLSKAHNYLVNTVESCSESDPNITKITGTQPQVKLGANIDVSLTSQYLTNVLPEFANDTNETSRIKRCITKCVNKISRNQNVNGSFNGAGWAGVLQTSITNNALEAAKSAGVQFDTTVLEKSRQYQIGLYDANTESVSTTDGAGITLYSISSTGRASAKTSYEAKKIVKDAKKAGLIDSDDVSVDNLVSSGLTKTEAMKYTAAYKTNSAASAMAMNEDVMKGFGNNGGEEFYSYLQTGEGLYISKDKAWETWYKNVIGRLVSIQLEDGNWQGHHCITSPVFCTATCTLILNGARV